MEKKIQHTYSTKRQKKTNTSSSSLLSNLFEESGMMGPRQWPSGVSYDSIHYLGDLSTVQFFYNKLHMQDHSTKLQGHTIKKFGDSVVLIADPGVSSQQSSKIPEFEWPQNIHPVGEDIHKYIYTVTGLDKYTAVRLLKM